MKTVTLTTLACILVFSSCGPGKPKERETAVLPYIIDIEKNFSNVKPVPLSSIGNKLEYIPLETTQESLLANAVEIEMTGSSIFVSDRRKLVEFDKEGRYIRTIGKQGRGPGEYLSVSDLCVDETNGNIYVIDEVQLLAYSFDGKFIESTKLPFYSLYFLFKYPDQLFYSTPNIPYQPTDSSYSWYITDVHGQNLEKIGSKVKKGIMLSGSPFYSFNGSVHFIEFGSDTLFYLQESEPEPYALLKFGNLKMEPSVIRKPNKEESSLWPAIINENIGHLFITCYRGFYGQINFVFNKQTLETVFPENNVFVNDLDGGLPFWPKYIYKDSALVDRVDAFKLIERIEEIKSSNNAGNGPELSDQLESLGKTLTENSNPVLILLKQ